MDEARRANKRERVSQSKCASTRFIRSLKHETLEKLRSRRESSESGDREMDFSPAGVSERE
jgi:hypothetical protein